MRLPPYRHHDTGPLVTIRHDRPGWIDIELVFDRPGLATNLHAHAFGHFMDCEAGPIAVELDGKTDVLSSGDQLWIEKGRQHRVVGLAANARALCRHEIRRENGQIDPEAFTEDGIPVEWVRRLTLAAA